MSRTFTNKTSTSQVGRGAVPKRSDNTRTNRNTQSSMASGNIRPGQSTRPGGNSLAHNPEIDGGEHPSAPGASQSAEDRIQRRDAYHVIPPNQQKREKNQAIAKKEEQQYKQYKDSKKVGHVSYVGTTGGGAVKLPEARSKAYAQHKQTLPAKRATGAGQQWKTNQKRLEEQQSDQHKATQRLKADRNKERDSARHRRLDGDRMAANDAFLAKLEKEAQQKRTAKVLSSSAAKENK